jgi:hypothetical protein
VNGPGFFQGFFYVLIESLKIMVEEKLLSACEARKAHCNTGTRCIFAAPSTLGEIKSGQ